MPIPQPSPWLAARAVSLLVAALSCLGAIARAREQSPDGQRAAAPGQQQDPPPQRQSGGAAPSDDAFKMGSPPALPEGQSEEQMWPAATAEGWRLPCLVRWQRTFEDAQRVARAEGRPILVAVNMDGEIASEHFAGVRYRELETAAQLGRYVCVVASVYRHTPRDYDVEGRRVECPRFGTVTCGEHIEAERELYEKYFEGKRISPRHIVLGLENEKTYDVYYSWDTATVFTTFRKGVEGWPEPIEPAERTLVQRLKSADVEDRQAVERAYREGDRETRRVLLETLIREPLVDQVELLRAAIFGFDLELAGLARQALARCTSEGALDLMAEVLKTSLKASDRELLLAAVARIAENSPRARTLASLHNGLLLESSHIDTEALAREYDASSVRKLDLEIRADAAERRPDEPGALLEFAEALVARAQESADRRYAELLFEDARSSALQAEELGARGPRLDVVAAVAAAGLGDFEQARTRAVAAVEGGLLRPADDGGPQAGELVAALTPASKARVLMLFAGARQRSIRAAYRAGTAWAPEWLSDVNAAYSILLRDELVDAQALVEYQDFLRWVGASSRANLVLDDALSRFPESPVLHDRLRARLLWDGGPEALERGYDERLASAEAADKPASQLTWFAGYASLVAAEQHRRRSEFEAAAAAYARSIARFERSLEQFASGGDSCRHYIALAQAGQSRMAFERGDLEAATNTLLGAFRLRPEAAATEDGLGITPIATAKMLIAKLIEQGDAGGAAEIQAALDALDPSLLEPPPSELQGAGRRRGRGLLRRTALVRRRASRADGEAAERAGCLHSKVTRRRASGHRTPARIYTRRLPCPRSWLSSCAS